MDAKELNKQIAEKVMGWELSVAYPGYWFRGTERVYVCGTRACLETWNPGGNWAHFGLVLERVHAVRGYTEIVLDTDHVAVAVGDKSAYCGLAGNVLAAACAAILEAWDA